MYMHAQQKMHSYNTYRYHSIPEDVVLGLIRGNVNMIASLRAKVLGVVVVGLFSGEIIGLSNAHFAEVNIAVKNGENIR